MASGTLHVTIRTPREVVLEIDVASLRVPTETGQVGLRPRGEPSVLAIEPGLIVMRLSDSSRFAGTAGGLLRCDGRVATLLTPLAAVGADISGVQEELERRLAAPSAEREARVTLKRLEKNILEQLHQSGHGSPAVGTADE